MVRGTPYSVRGTPYSVRGTPYSLRGTPYSVRGTSYSVAQTTVVRRSTYMVVGGESDGFAPSTHMVGRVQQSPARQQQQQQYFKTPTTPSSLSHMLTMHR